MSSQIPVAYMNYPTRMVVGPGARAQLANEVTRLQVRRVLLVSDPSLANIGLVDEVQKVLDDRFEVTRYLGVSKNPVGEDVEEGVLAFKDCQAEAVIGLGGGAPMDVAKAIALRAHNPGPLLQYDDAAGGDQNVRAPIPPIIAIPTTAGTGSEVGRASVIVLGPDHRKVILFHPDLMPSVAVLDAELTAGLPPALTAATGMDALTHLLEAYVAVGEHPFADMFALSGLARVGRYLVRAFQNGGDLVARHQMLLASCQGATAFQKGLGLCHAMAHPLGSIAGVHHGLANAICLSHVVRYNLPAARGRYAVASRALGVQVRGDDPDERARGLVEFLDDLGQTLSIPARLSEVGVRSEQVARMVPQALTDPSLPGNPRPVDAGVLHSLYEAAL